VSGREDLRRALPWVLCAVSLGLLTLSSVLRWVLVDVGGDEHIGWLEGVIGALGFAGIPVVGALIASRLPANAYGWVWCLTGLAYAMADVARPLVRAVGGPLWVAWAVQGWSFGCLVTLFVFLFLLFPTGRLPTHRWRWLARAAGTVAPLLMLLVPFTYDPAEPATAGPWAVRGAAGRYLDQLTEVGVVAMFGLVLAAMSALVLRFRRAGAVERRQLTWFLYATVLNGLFLALDTVNLIPDRLFFAAVSAAAFALLPLAVGVAVLRYRLYEIDRIVSRTVSYGLLSALLVGLYLLVVTLLRPLLEPFTGNSTLAVAGSTLAVAALFNPARRRLQSVVDRRFDRARYDAIRAVDAFTARLRDQVDLDEIAVGLRDTVDGTVAPVRIGLWLTRPAGRETG
jgi:hypothetical protein